MVGPVKVKMPYIDGMLRNRVAELLKNFDMTNPSTFEEASIGAKFAKVFTGTSSVFEVVLPSLVDEAYSMVRFVAENNGMNYYNVRDTFEVDLKTAEPVGWCTQEE